MAGWEEELSALLSKLGVKQEEPRTQIQQAQHTYKPIRRDTRQHEQIAGAFYWGENEDMMEEDEVWIDDLDIMRREVDAIVSQVVILLQHGNLNPTIKEDVMVVLHALNQRIPSAKNISSDEAYLESASALLHFCRLVLQLSEFATEDS
jgi:hypothetical protein